MGLIKKAKWAYIIVSVVMILLGIVLAACPGMSMQMACYVIGGLMALFGVIKLVGYFSKDLFRLAFQFDFALGIFSLILGGLILIRPMYMALVMQIIIGGFVLMDGVFKVQTAHDAKHFGIRRWWAILLLAIVTCLSGLLLMADPFAGGQALMILMGVTLVVDGVQNLCVVAYTVKA